MPAKQSSKRPHVTITEFRLPHASTSPGDIVAGPDGNMWFTEDNSPLNVNTIIARITPTGKITEFRDTLPIGASSGAAFGLAVAPSGELWFGENVGFTHIGWITPAGKISYYHYGEGLRFDDSYDYDTRTLAWGPDGNVWFAFLDRIVRLAPPPSTARTEFPLPHHVGAVEITNGPDGNLWFTGVVGTTAIVPNYIGRITPSGAVTLFRIPGFNTAPGHIVVGPDRTMWFTEAGGIGRITTTGKITQFRDKIPHSVPQGLAVGRGGNVWFADLPTNSVGRMTPSGHATEYRLRTPHAFVWGMAAARNGDIWFTEGQAGKIGRIHVQ